MIQALPLPKSLLLLSPVSARETEGETISLARKYVDGVCAIAALWQGPVTLLLSGFQRRDETLDNVTVRRRELNFTVCTFPNDNRTLRAYLQTAGLVLVPMLPWYRKIVPLCLELNVPVVSDTDHYPKLREDIIRAETKNPLVRWRRLRWVRRLEPDYRTMIRGAAGTQMNGVSTYDAYAPLSRFPLLYLSTRVRRGDLVTEAQRRMRAERLRAGAPLRLVYSGRWNAMKGADDLPRVAAALRQEGVKFVLDIFGGGTLEPELRRAVANAQLENVRLHGALPFPELMRFITNESDLYVCCHRQGDPSATFVETMGAGVPLIGYHREGLGNIVAHAKAGFLSPPDDPSALAARIAQLDRDRDALVSAAEAAAKFAGTHTFENITRMRVEHLRAVARMARP